jgi:hypothetical protein
MLPGGEREKGRESLSDRERREGEWRRGKRGSESQITRKGGWQEKTETERGRSDRN